MGLQKMLEVTITDGHKLSEGDQVLIHVSTNWGLEEMKQAKKELDERFVGVNFVFISGIESIEVLKAGA